MKKIIFMFLATLLASNSFSQNQKITDNLQKKIQFLNPAEHTRIMILLNDQVDIESLDKELYRTNAPLDYRAQTVINTLRQKAQQTQGPVLEYLKSEKNKGKVNELTNFWIINAICADVTPDVILSLSTRTEIQSIDLDNEISIDLPVDKNPVPPDYSIGSVEPGLKAIKADILWKLGITGAGRTVMNVDTGIDGLHPALAPRWWGNNGRPWNQSWFDPLDHTTSPTDCQSHGTHTMGTMCGRDAATGDTIGVAPDAYWMGAGLIDCRPFGFSYTSYIVASYQWAMDPDSNSITMDMPDVINCSWWDPNGDCSSIYVPTLSAVEAAGIAVVFSAGNQGPNPTTIDSPGNINTDSVNTFCVGAVDGSNSEYPITWFSSRGPSICGGSGTLLIKPEVSAPGLNVRSSIPGNSYELESGTSMAAPHAAGCIALLKQAMPNMTGKQLKAFLFTTSTDLGIPGEDNAYGKGLINVYAALQELGYFHLHPFNIQTPSSGVTITALPNSSTPVTLTWDTSATAAKYKWIFGSPTTSPRIITLSSSTNSLTITLGQLDSLLANAGVAQGNSLSGQFDVWSFRPNSVDSISTSNGPRAITLRRGIPALSNFNLVSPSNGVSITTSAPNTSLININWSRSGKSATYKWKFGTPDLSNIILSYESDNQGYDSTLTFNNNLLDGILHELGIEPGDSVVGQWSVWAYNNSDSAKASQNYSLTLKRDKKDVVVIYDSTNANCRISKDSVVANLNGLDLTHQLYNRKGFLATNSISFKSYDKVILLGEGNSVMSNSIKDSLKAYLNSGDSLRKAKLIIMSEDIGYQLDRSASILYDSTFCRSMCGFQFVADRPGLAGPKGIVGVYINNLWADSSNGPSTDVIKRSASVPLSQTQNLYKYRLYNDSMNAVGRISNTYNVAVFAVDAESLRPAFDSPSGSALKRLLKGGLNFVDEIITSVNPSTMSGIPQEYSLSQNFPNPFNPTTKINFSIPKQGLVTLKIYDVVGKEVMTLVNESRAIGNYEVEFNGSNLASGAYFYRIEAGEFNDIKRMILIK